MYYYSIILQHYCIIALGSWKSRIYLLRNSVQPFLTYSPIYLFTMGRHIISLDDLTKNNVGVLKTIVNTVLPVSYPDSWYNDCLQTSQVVKLVYYAELPVGVIKGKPINNSGNSISTLELVNSHVVPSKLVPNAMYIEVLAVLPAYQHLGIGKTLLDFVIEETKKRFIHEILLHVHVDNTAAIEWYQARGFEKGSVVKNYYANQNLPSPDAILLSLKV